jgi:hypothetical protein
VALKNLDNTPITPQSLDPTDRTQLITHWYPFDALPLIESHIRPEFAIFDAGAKLAKMMQSKNTGKFDELVQKFPSLLSIIDLYNVWIRAPPPDAQTDILYNAPLDPPDDGDDDDDDDDDDDNHNDKDDDYHPKSQGSQKRKAPAVEPAVEQKRSKGGSTVEPLKGTF